MLPGPEPVEAKLPAAMAQRAVPPPELWLAAKRRVVTPQHLRQALAQQEAAATMLPLER